MQDQPGRHVVDRNGSRLGRYGRKLVDNCLKENQFRRLIVSLRLAHDLPYALRGAMLREAEDGDSPAFDNHSIASTFVAKGIGYFRSRNEQASLVITT